MYHNIAIIGSAGAIGNAMLEQLATTQPAATIYAFSQHHITSNYANVYCDNVDYTDESSIAKAAAIATADMPLDLVLITTGILHQDGIMPEKSLHDLTHQKFQTMFAANTILPAMVAKHFLPKLYQHKRAILAALSARVGSISDNHLGGWYAYRASKAALNMIIKNAAIEIGRCNKDAVIVGLHPGTVDSHLSKPFQKNVPDGKLFTPAFSAQKLLDVLTKLTPEQSGSCFAWDGQEISP